MSQFSLVCSNDVQRSLGSSSYMAAKIIGSILFGVMSDKFGRKKVLVAASLLTAAVQAAPGHHAGPGHRRHHGSRQPRTLPQHLEQRLVRGAVTRCSDI